MPGEAKSNNESEVPVKGDDKKKEATKADGEEEDKPIKTLDADDIAILNKYVRMIVLLL